MTFEEWIKPASTASMAVWEYERVLGSYVGSDVGIQLYINQPSAGTFYVNLTDVNNVANTSFNSASGLLVAGVWQHIALTYDKTSGIAVIYVNGSAVVQTNLGSFTPQTTFTNLVIGARTTYASVTSPGYPFSGSMDEVSLYNRALTAAEIQAIYQAGSLGKCFNPTPPVIITQPTNQTAYVGSTATFTVIAAGTPPLSYQWSFNSNNIVNATNATLTLANVQLTNAGNYWVTVTNLYGATNSATAVLTVNVQQPFIITQPVSQTNSVGSTATFSVTAGGTPPLIYQWRWNGTNLVNSTSPILTLTNVQLTNAGNYSVTITNLYGGPTAPRPY